MQIETTIGTLEVQDLTRGQRRRLAALYPAAFIRGEDGEMAYHPRHFHELCELTLELSGLDEDKVFDGKSAIEQNSILVGIASEYAGGLSGKGSGA